MHCYYSASLENLECLDYLDYLDHLEYLENIDTLVDRIILAENLHTLIEQVVLVIVDKRRTYTQTFLSASRGDEADGTHTIVHQFVSQLTAGHPWIANGEIETVGDGIAKVMVIDNVEAMTLEDFL